MSVISIAVISESAVIHNQSKGDHLRTEVRANSRRTPLQNCIVLLDLELLM